MRLWLELPDGAVQRLNSKGSFRVPAGARLVTETPGSGGYGPPPARDDPLVHEDCADGYVTPRGGQRGMISSSIGCNAEHSVPTTRGHSDAARRHFRRSGRGGRGLRRPYSARNVDASA
jgi:hypothetical protein